MTDRLKMLILLGLILVALTGCVQRQNLEEKQYSLTIFLDGPLPQSSSVKDESPLPDELVALCLPISDNSCSTMFYPQVRLVRGDRKPAQESDLKAITPSEVRKEIGHQDPSVLNKVRRFYGLGPTIQQSRDYVHERLRHEQLEPTLVGFGEINSAEDIAENADAFLQEAAPQKIIMLGTSEQKSAVWRNKFGRKYDISAAKDIDDGLRLIGEHLCRSSKKESSDVPGIVLYSAKNSDILSRTKTGPVPGGVDPKVSADEVYRRIAARVEKKPMGQELKNLLDELNHLEGEGAYAIDFRFPYEHAKLVIFGTQDHHEGFELLSKAAEKAKKAGDTEKMLPLLKKDGAENGVFHKLAHGHEEWHKILDTLEERHPESHQLEKK